MKISRRLSLAEFAALVASELREKGIDTVLTGGAVVSIYTENKYESYDVDFISPDDHRTIAKAMSELGFEKRGKDFVHPDSDFFVEFPAGPLSLGNELIKAEGKLIVKGNKLVLLSPTQSVMDRLAAYFYWNDKQSLDQALWIAEKHPTKLSKIQSWAKAEGQKDKYEDFLIALRRQHRK